MTTQVFYIDGKIVGSIESDYRLIIGEYILLNMLEHKEVNPFKDYPNSDVFDKEDYDKFNLNEKRLEERRNKYSGKTIRIESKETELVSARGSSSLVIHCYCKVK